MIMRIIGQRYPITQAHLELMQVPERFWLAKFTGITSEALKRETDNYIRNLDSMLSNGGGLLFWGDNSIGKTSAAVVIGKRARSLGAPVLFVTAAKLLAGIFEKTRFDDETLLIQRARDVDLLIIDDLGKEHEDKSGFSDSVMENLFRDRSSRKRAIIATSNIHLKPDPSRPGRSLVERYSKSMMEVMKECMVPVYAEGDNRRDEGGRILRERLQKG